MISHQIADAIIERAIIAMLQHQRLPPGGAEYLFHLVGQILGRRKIGIEGRKLVGRGRWTLVLRLLGPLPRLQALLAQIAARGHEIGLHGSFNTYRDGAQLGRDRERLRAALVRARAEARSGTDAGAGGSTGAKAGPGASDDPLVRGNRQHYLRWDAATTPDLLEQAGFDYEASGGFPYDPGFRHGTAREFPMWSWKKQGPLRLRQRPLMLMESAVLGDPGSALEHMARLKHTALRYGDFNLLWHNSRFTEPGDRELFRQILAA